MIRVCLKMMIAALTVAMTAQARADFRLEAHPAPPIAGLSASPGAVMASPPSQDEEATVGKPKPSPFKEAHGFGDDVPLSFATRMIVPPSVTVRYGPGVDPNSVVSWKGKAPWNRVLAAALRPLKLRLVTGAKSALITR